jgi:hypothetical protein
MRDSIAGDGVAGGPLSRAATLSMITLTDRQHREH